MICQNLRLLLLKIYLFNYKLLIYCTATFILKNNVQGRTNIITANLFKGKSFIDALSFGTACLLRSSLSIYPFDIYVHIKLEFPYKARILSHLYIFLFGDFSTNRLSESTILILILFWLPCKVVSHI